MSLVEQKQAAENLLQQAGAVPGMEDVAVLITQKIAALQEKISQKEQEREAQEKLLEQAKAMGMEDVVALIESKMQETNDFVKKATTTPESTIKNIETSGGGI